MTTYEIGALELALAFTAWLPAGYLGKVRALREERVRTSRLKRRLASACCLALLCAWSMQLWRNAAFMIEAHQAALVPVAHCFLLACEAGFVALCYWRGRVRGTEIARTKVRLW